LCPDPWDRGQLVSQQTTDRSFDELARALAEGSINRRRALKLFAGTAIAALIPSRALADDDDCVRVCHVPFDRETGECNFAEAKTRCVSRSRRRFHLKNHPCDCRGRCANCLTTCLPIAGTCSANDQCCSGRCAGGTCAEACPDGRVLLDNGTCAKPCSTNDDCAGCGGDEECVQGSLISGESYCAVGLGSREPCTDASQCTLGEFCNSDQCVAAC
jgi:hypothetical protein